MLLGYATLVLGVGGIVNFVEHVPQLHLAIITYLGSVESFARMLTFGWYFTILAHGFEALFVGLHAKRSLKLKQEAITKWVVFTVIAGLPILNRFLQYLEAQQVGKKDKRE